MTSHDRDPLGSRPDDGPRASDWEADRRGIHPAAWIGGIAAFVIVAFLVVGLAGKTGNNQPGLASDNSSALTQRAPENPAPAPATTTGSGSTNSGPASSPGMAR